MGSWLSLNGSAMSAICSWEARLSLSQNGHGAGERAAKFNDRRPVRPCRSPLAALRLGSTTATLFSASEETIEQRCNTAKRNSNIKQQSLAGQLFELRELVREAETISRTGKSATRRCSPRLVKSAKFRLRVRPETSGRITEFSEHE